MYLKEKAKQTFATGLILILLCLLLPLTTTAQTDDITSLSDITNMAGSYRLTADVSGAGHTTITGPFTGTLTLKGTTTVGTANDNTTGNVYGGGNNGPVGGNSEVTIRNDE